MFHPWPPASTKIIFLVVDVERKEVCFDVNMQGEVKNRTQERKNLREVWAASRADVLRVCREEVEGGTGRGSRGAHWNEARRTCWMNLYVDVVRRVMWFDMFKFWRSVLASHQVDRKLEKGVSLHNLDFVDSDQWQWFSLFFVNLARTWKMTVSTYPGYHATARINGSSQGYEPKDARTEDSFEKVIVRYNVSPMIW